MNATPHRVQPYLDDGDLRLYHGDALTVLRSLPTGIAQTCVTSPPYWNLRDYGTGTWTGGDEACDHKKQAVKDRGEDFRKRGEERGYAPGSNFSNYGDRNATATDFDDVCGKCGARRVDDQLGLEATPDQYVAKIVEVFREVRRVLRDDGTLWCNLGDSFLPGKQLAGVPWRVAFALQADGWYLRSDIIWSKPNPMPESVTDRPTKAHEYVFLFSKQPRYYFDQDAVREPQDSLGERHNGKSGYREDHPSKGGITERSLHPAGRNQRSVWQIATEPFPEAHFATYPQELVRRCIQAGTSERGECVECGAPWRRETEGVEQTRSEAPSGTNQVNHSRNTPELEVARRGPGTSLSNNPRHRTPPPQTIGWSPTCACPFPNPFMADGIEEPRPQLVLDPFIGSGTTSLVARKHGRRSIGIDLSAEYLAIAAKRTQQLSLLGGAA